jgi:tetratricopeptide (TPR) repeat protein
MVSTSIESLCVKARQAVAKGEYAQARQLYNDGLALKADAPDVHYGLATVCFLLNDLPSAAHHFKEVTRLDPLRAGAHINLGAVYNRLDQIDEAIESLRRGIQLDTHRAEGYYNLGVAYKHKKQLDLCVQAYSEAVRLNPRMADAHLNLANAYLETGQYRQSLSHYSKCLHLRPNWEKAEQGLAQAEAALASGERGTGRTSPHRVATQPEAETEAALATTAILDPERMIDPNLHGSILSILHQAAVEAENLGRSFLLILEKEVEPAIKEFSSCLLYPDSTASELDACVMKMEVALRNMQMAQRSLEGSLLQIHTLGERLIKS